LDLVAAPGSLPLPNERVNDSSGVVRAHQARTDHARITREVVRPTRNNQPLNTLNCAYAEKEARAIVEMCAITQLRGSLS
jgi:hypothetical protein